MFRWKLDKELSQRLVFYYHISKRQNLFIINASQRLYKIISFKIPYATSYSTFLYKKNKPAMVHSKLHLR